MADLWHSRSPPQALDLDALLAEGADGGAGGGQGASGSGGTLGGSAARALGLADTHAVWPLAQQARLFLVAVQAYQDERGEELGAAQVGGLCGWLCVILCGLLPEPGG